MSERLNDMLDRYGEVCPQKKAAQILVSIAGTILGFVYCSNNRFA